MKRQLLLSISFLLLLFNAKGQQVDSMFTLKECIDYSLANQPNILNAHINEEITRHKVQETRAIGYPTLKAEASLVDNPQLQRMFLRNGVIPSFPADPTKPIGAAISIPNIFQLRDAGDAKLTLSQLLFDGSYLVGLQAASTYRELAVKSTEQTKIQTIEQVTKAYYMVVINEERAKIFSVNVERLDSLLYQTKKLKENGFVEDIDISRIEVQRNNLLTEKNKFEKLKALGELLLKFQMGMSLEQPIAIEESIDKYELQVNNIENTEFDYTKRIEYSLLSTQERLQSLDLKRIRYARLPTIAAFARGGYFVQETKFSNLFTSPWYTYSMLGVSFSMNLLNLPSQYQAQQAKLNIKVTQNNMTNFKNASQLEVATTKANHMNNLQTMQNEKRNMELAQEVARVTKIKYKEGVGSNLEVTNAESDLKAAQINYFSALYDALVSKIEYQKSTGTLYQGQ